MTMQSTQSNFRAGFYVVVYLAAIVTANLLTTRYGVAVIYWNAFFLIGLDLATRNRLQDLWPNRRLRMGGLIIAGGALSLLVNLDAARIALASSASFIASEGVEWAIYRRARVLAGVPAALVDSFLFPTLAFGAFVLSVSLKQAAAKIGGLIFWTVLIAVTRYVLSLRDRAAPPPESRAASPTAALQLDPDDGRRRHPMGGR